MTRRAFLSAAAATAAVPLNAAPRTGMGVAVTSYLSFARYRETYQFLEKCAALGAGGIQAGLSNTDPAYLKKVRSRAEELGMYLEVMAGLPKGDPAAFENSVKAAKEMGAVCLRAGCLNGRRYETFSSLEQWKKFAADSRASLDAAVPLAEKYKLPIALENHKDWTVDEMTALLKSFSSEYLGCCIDTGNNIALLDDPMELVDRLAPYALSTHLKDMGMEPWKDGFLLSELPLGEGSLDLKRIVAAIRKSRPNVRMTLEMITRDPLEIPCLTEKYWATFPDRSGTYLARTLAYVRNNTKSEALPRTKHLSKEAQISLEEDNVKQCLHYARERLSL